MVILHKIQNIQDYSGRFSIFILIIYHNIY